MTIDEAIAHAREVAEIQRNNDKLNKTLGKSSPYYNTDCIKCAEEHGQLAEWLEELKAYRQYIDLTEIPEQYKLGFQDGIIAGNNKAIDEAICKVEEHKTKGYVTGITNNPFEFGACQMADDIVKILEQLKAGGENEN